MPYDELRKGRFSEKNRAYFVTSVLDKRIPYFQDFWCARLLVHEMRQLHEEQQVFSIAWVIMPDHLHWLFQLTGHYSLSQIMKYLKARSSKQINTYLQRQGTIWQKSYYDHALRDNEDIKTTARYIIANPLRANLTEKINDYSLWDAMWL